MQQPGLISKLYVDQLPLPYMWMLEEILSLTKCSYFITERKAAIPLEDATVKLSDSYTSSLSAGTALFWITFFGDFVLKAGKQIFIVEP